MRQESCTTVSPSTRIGTLSCLLNAIAALSLTRTGWYATASPQCASAMRVRHENRL
jgi:hypothetical protein